MARKSRSEIQIQKFESIIRELMKISGKSFKKVILAEGGHVLAGAMRGTRTANIKRIVTHQMPIGQKFNRYVGEKEFGKLGSNWHSLKARHPPQRWQELINNRENRTEKILGNRGITASQFFIMSKMLKIKLPKLPAKAVQNSSHNKIKRFLKPRKKGFGSMYSLIFESNIKGSSWTGKKPSKFKSAKYVLTNKVAGRTKMYSRAINKQFLKEIKFRTKNYPLLFS